MSHAIEKISALFASIAFISMGLMEQVFSLLLSLFVLGAMIGAMNVAKKSSEKNAYHSHLPFIS